VSVCLLEIFVAAPEKFFDLECFLLVFYELRDLAALPITLETLPEHFLTV
jgi:hypothetical protein